RRAIHPNDSDLVRHAYYRFFEASLPDGVALRRSFCSQLDDATEEGGDEIGLYDVKYRFLREDGNWVWIHERANYVEFKNGRWYANGISSDITALKMAEAELERHHFRLAELVDERTSELLSVNQKLKQEIKVRRHTEQALVELTARLSASNQELDQFAHVASHELKEPLMLIGAFTERLGNKYAHCFNEKGKEYLSRIKAAAEHMRQLVDGFLSLSQVTSGGQSYEEIDLNDLVREVLQDLEGRIMESKALIEIGDLGRMGGDRVQMRQLFQNIIANALKYSKPGASPRVVLRGGVADDEDFYEILIQDNGIGFDPRDAERIFKPLERLHSRREYEGTGMGLTTCQKIVARHGGEIVARGALGQGATFIIRLPASLIKLK
ncbi:MAG: ATP-binding protein, partial [Desulfobulbaceae bacterium]|nr:ATP-binding protein [Desulfobulbaceae bacterium]